MTVRNILKMGDPRLLRVASPVTQFDTDELHLLVHDMIDTMMAVNGAGLAAPQIGVDLQLVILARTNPASATPMHHLSHAPCCATRSSSPCQARRFQIGRAACPYLDCAGWYPAGHASGTRALIHSGTLLTERWTVFTHAWFNTNVTT